MYIVTLIILAASLLAALLISSRGLPGRRPKIIAHLCNLGVSTHEIAKTYLTDAAVATRYLLGKIGTDAAHVAACGASDIPIGVITDEAAAAEEEKAVELLGISNRTLPMVASEAITAGEAVYTAAAGKVQDLPTGAGTYYLVGYALTAAAADLDVIEVLHCAPIATVVP